MSDSEILISDKQDEEDDIFNWVRVIRMALYLVVVLFMGAQLGVAIWYMFKSSHVAYTNLTKWLRMIIISSIINIVFFIGLIISEFRCEQVDIIKPSPAFDIIPSIICITGSIINTVAIVEIRDIMTQLKNSATQTNTDDYTFAIDYDNESKKFEFLFYLSVSLAGIMFLFTIGITGKNIFDTRSKSETYRKQREQLRIQVRKREQDAIVQEQQERKAKDLERKAEKTQKFVKKSLDESKIQKERLELSQQNLNLSETNKQKLEKQTKDFEELLPNRINKQAQQPIMDTPSLELVQGNRQSTKTNLEELDFNFHFCGRH